MISATMILIDTKFRHRNYREISQNLKYFVVKCKRKFKPQGDATTHLLE